jgi:hypothetical protein
MLAATLVAATMHASAGSAATVAPAACGTQTIATIAGVDSRVANNIYRGELTGGETQKDLVHVTTEPALLAAVAADNRSATFRAVQRIVYHHFWHIVRLRVLDASGRLLADVGGPYVIAPIDGTLQSGGRSIGSFVMSVQDDLGFAKLERRAIGDPIGIYLNGRLAVTWGAKFPAAAPAATSLTLDGVVYSTVALTYNAFPAGTLTAVIAMPLPLASLSAQPCTAVVVGQVGLIAERLALRFHPLAASYPNYAITVHADTGAMVVVRIGLRAIAGAEGPGPAALPLSGTVTYQGRNWSVFSFAPTPPARIYILVAQP